ncbi:MAG: tetratricopeptide repeat protein [Planctomycetaceae bacterium]
MNSPPASPVVTARSLLQQGKIPEARQLLTEFVAAHPRDRDGQELLGMAMFMARDFSGARQTFEQLTRNDPMYAPGWVNLGAVQNVMKDYNGALRSLRKALQRDKRSASAYYNMGIAQKALNMNSMAVSAYREALKIEPRMPEPYTNLGNLYIDMKNYAQAIRILEEGLQHCPGNQKIAAILAKAQARKEETRRNESPLGRLVDEDELARKQALRTRADLAPEVRISERDSLREISKTIRELTRPVVAMLDENLQKQLHWLQMAAVQTDVRGEAVTAFDEFVRTLDLLDRHRCATMEAVSQIRTNLQKTDPGL